MGVTWDPERLIEEERVIHPGAVALAERASIAALIDSATLRWLRLKLLPHVDASAEADLWLGPLVMARGPRSILLRTDISQVLRENLAKRQEALRATHDQLKKVHADAPAILRYEEDLIWLGLTAGSGGSGRKRIQEAVGRIAAAFATSDRSLDLAAWAARALPGLPDSVVETTSLQVLALAASSRLGGQRLIPIPEKAHHFQPIPTLLPSDGTMVNVSVRREGDRLRIQRGHGDALHVRLPLTAPLLLEVSYGGHRRAVAVPDREAIDMTVGQGSVQLQSLLGQRWALPPLGTAATLGYRNNLGIISMTPPGIVPFPEWKGPYEGLDVDHMSLPVPTLDRTGWERLLDGIRSKVPAFCKGLSQLDVGAEIPAAAAALLGSILPRSGLTVRPHQWDPVSGWLPVVSMQEPQHTDGQPMLKLWEVYHSERVDSPGIVVVSVDLTGWTKKVSLDDLPKNNLLATYALAPSSFLSLFPNLALAAARQINDLFGQIALKYPYSAIHLHYQGPAATLILAARQSHAWRIPVCVYGDVLGEGTRPVPVLRMPEGLSLLHGQDIPKGGMPSGEPQTLTGGALVRLLTEFVERGRTVHLGSEDRAVPVKATAIEGTYLTLRAQPDDFLEMLSQSTLGFHLRVPFSLTCFTAKVLLEEVRKSSETCEYQVVMPETLERLERRSQARISIGAGSYVQLHATDREVMVFPLADLGDAGVGLRLDRIPQEFPEVGTPVFLVIVLRKGPRLHVLGELRHLSWNSAGIAFAPEAEAFFRCALNAWLVPRLEKERIHGGFFLPNCEPHFLDACKIATVTLSDLTAEAGDSARSEPFQHRHFPSLSNREEVLPESPGEVRQRSKEWLDPRPLGKNRGVAFRGIELGGPFLVEPNLAQRWLSAPLNADGRHNGDVLRPWLTGADLVRGGSRQWVLDFQRAPGLPGTLTSTEVEKALHAYAEPFAYLTREVKPIRSASLKRRAWYAFRSPRPRMREALEGLPRYLATPAVGRHLLFVWVPKDTLPASTLIAFAIHGDAPFGVLQSRIHDLWAHRYGTRSCENLHYVPQNCFESFPFPGNLSAPQVAKAARDLAAAREAWLAPVSLGLASQPQGLVALYTEREAGRAPWLDRLHRQLDLAVLKAYGWEDVAEPLFAEERKLHAENPSGLPLAPMLIKTAAGREILQRLWSMNVGASVGSTRGKLGLRTFGLRTFGLRTFGLRKRAAAHHPVSSKFDLP